MDWNGGREARVGLFDFFKSKPSLTLLLVSSHASIAPGMLRPMFLLLACTGPKDDSAAPKLVGPQIEVSPTAIAFETPNGSLGVEVVIVSNMGDEDLELTRIAAAADPPSLSLGEVGTALVPPSSFTSFTAQWAPDGTNLDTSILIDSNDADDPTVEIPVTGRGEAAR